MTTASSSQAGAAVFLSNITLPADGIYHVSVQATAGEPNARGFYDLLVADATVHPSPLTINQTVTGQLLDRYSVDAWTFSSTAGQQVTFNVVATASPDIEFDLIGPNGQSVFSGINGSTGPIDLTAAGAYVLRVHTVGSGRRLRLPVRPGLADPAHPEHALPGHSRRQRPVAALQRRARRQATRSRSASPTPIRRTRTRSTSRSASRRRETAMTTASAAARAANQKVVLTGKPGTYYILVYNNFVQTAGNYTIEADSAPFLLSGMNPTTIGNAGNTTVQLSGVFPLGTGQRRLRAEDGSHAPARRPARHGRPRHHDCADSAALRQRRRPGGRGESRRDDDRLCRDCRRRGHARHLFRAASPTTPAIRRRSRTSSRSCRAASASSRPT